jgi:TonB family protein
MTAYFAGFESLLLTVLANALWQVPLLFAAGWLAARALRPLGPVAEHRVWVAVLLLQASLPVASVIPWETLRNLLNLSGDSLNNGSPHVSVVMGPGSAFGNPHMPAWFLTLIALAYAGITAYFAAQYAWRLLKVRHLRRTAIPTHLSGDADTYWSECEQRFAMPNAALATSTGVSGPATIGITRKLVLLPAALCANLPAPELHTAIAHEFAHMRRHDFLKNLLYELLSLPVRFHPFLSLTRKRLTESREMVCDQLAAGLAEPHQYARSLLRMAALLVDGVPTSLTPHPGSPRTGPRPWGGSATIGILDSTSFERRVMRLTHAPIQPSPLRRVATIAAGILLGAGITATTVALGVHVDALAAGDEHRPSQPNGPVNVRPDIMQVQVVHKVPPVYPEDAKKKRIQGKVLLDAIIGKTGEVENLKVISGEPMLQQSSLDAVRQWTYKPFLLNGAPVEVKTTITVIYTLGMPKNRSETKPAQ